MEENARMRIPRIDPKDATGLFDKVVGLGKEVFGEAFDERRLIEAGEAQQAKGTGTRVEGRDAHAKAEVRRGLTDPSNCGLRSLRRPQPATVFGEKPFANELVAAMTAR